MSLTLKPSHLTSILGCIAISVFVIIATFPDNEWAYSTGIDYPLAWLYNYVFEKDLSLGKSIIFPHGPLVFFTYPGPDNILLAVAVTAVLKMLLTFQVFLLLSEEKKNVLVWSATFVISYGLLIVSGFNQILLINILLLYCNFFISGKPVFKFTAFLLTAFALFVKAYVAVVSGVIFVSFVAYYFFTNKRMKPVLQDGCLLLAFVLAFWLLMYHSFSGFISYLWGLAHLTQDNSSGAAYYPYNNWLLLALFLASLLGILLFNRTPRALFYTALSLFSLFAAWKHGMAREDTVHARSFLIYVIICLTVFIAFVKNKTCLNILLSLIAFTVFSINLRNVVFYFPWEPEWFRATYFFEFISDFSLLKENANNQSTQNIFPNKLPEDMRTAIADAPADVYPWDYSIVAANDLNWQPRIVIQSYAAYTSWLDSRNAEHFGSSLAPEFLIWEKKKITTDVNGGDFNSIDNRYLLNDEPQTMIQLMRHYDFFAADKKFLILKKRHTPISVSVQPLGQLQTSWEKWILVPTTTGQLLRARLNFSKTMLQSLKSFLYKDEQFWIYLKLKNKLIHKYRIVPKNAEDGLWITPYLLDSEHMPEVEQIMFSASAQHLLTDQLHISWETISFEKHSHRAEQFFHITASAPDSTLLYSSNDFEQASLKNWRAVATNAQAGASFSGSRSQLLKPESYSSTFSISLDSLPFQDLKISTDCWVNPLRYKSSHSIMLTISIDDEKGNVLWKAIQIDDQIIDENRWNHIYHLIDYKHRSPNCKLTVYLHNNSNEDILVDDFRVMVEGRK